MRNPGGVLGEIVARKRTDVAARLQGQTLESLRARAEPTERSLHDALGRPGARFIMEMKRTSPSKGASAGHNPGVVARAYSGVADAVSVLTDGPYFGGSFDDLAAVRRVFEGPILCKDFTVDVRQVAEARIHGADAVLVMLSVLDDDEAALCLNEAERHRMGAIVEVHDEEELARAERLGAAIIGINNRDLKTLKTDLAVTERLAPLAAPGSILISESGIATHADVERLASLVDAFLVGSSLMAEADIAGAARRLVFGRVKVCGLGRVEDLQAARLLGASYGGLIFVEGSPRRVSVETGRALAEAARACGLPLVGVFRDAPAEDVARAAGELGLSAVQLHGSEDESVVSVLRERLGDTREIWKSVPVVEGEPINGSGSSADRILFDTKIDGAFGGTGRSFDWGRIASQPLDKAIIAGGLSPDNAADAAALGAWAIDLCSGVEESAGIKSAEKLAALFEALRPDSREGVN